jgi:type IV pilus assembly protein PilA
MRQNKGFSLVELMIVVAIIGILAAIALPNFVAMQLKAKRGEVPFNVDGIKTAELAYDAAFDGYVEATVFPRASGALDKTPAAWDEASSGGFRTIGWKPDGAVRGNYAVATSATDITVTGECDVDDDGSEAQYMATTSINAVLRSSDTNVYESFGPNDGGRVREGPPLHLPDKRFL